MTRSFLLSGAMTLALPFAALAVGNEEDVPPLPTQTTTHCAEGSVWDSTAQLCVAIEDTGLVTDPEILIPTVRELAYAGRHADALALLARAPDQGDSMVLTYMGYSTRSLGDMAGGMAYYDRALAADADNLLLRAYMGMAWLIQGQPAQARIQLTEIRARGGAGGWPEHALAAAIEQGSADGYDY